MVESGLSLLDYARVHEPGMDSRKFGKLHLAISFFSYDSNGIVKLRETKMI